MKVKPYYSSKTKRIFRLISISAIVILLLATIHGVVSKGFSNKKDVFWFVLNCANICLACILFIFPTKIELIAIGAFLYSFVILLFEPENAMGEMMYFLAVMFLYARGFYIRHKKVKNIITIIVFACLVLSELRFGFDVFLRAVIETWGFSLVLGIIVFFSNAYFSNLFETRLDMHKLDLQKYPGLKPRDALWLTKILNGEKYDSIAVEENLSSGTVKNRLKYIFEILGVGDRRGFLARYYGYEIFYTETEDDILQEEQTEAFDEEINEENFFTESIE